MRYASSWDVRLTLISPACVFPYEGQGKTLDLVDYGAKFYESRLFMADQRELEAFSLEVDGNLIL